MWPISWDSSKLLHCRALEYVDIAAQTEPTTVFNSFLRLKVHLLQKDCTSAVSQIQAMMKCEDFSHEILRVSHKLLGHVNAAFWALCRLNCSPTMA